MTAPGSALPPPPPLTAPPGNWIPGRRRIGGLAKALLIVLGVLAVGQIVATATIPSAIDAAVDFMESGDEAAFDDGMAPHQAASVLTGLLQIAVVVLSVIWLFRVAANHRALGRQTTWGPGWAIAGWVLPPLVYIIPLLMLRETSRAATPEVPPGSPAWRQQGESPLVWIWFVIFCIAPFVLLVLGASQFRNLMEGERGDIAEYYDEQRGVLVASGALTLLSVLAWGLLVRDITRRHALLSEEAAR